VSKAVVYTNHHYKNLTFYYCTSQVDTFVLHNTESYLSLDYWVVITTLSILSSIISYCM